MVWSARVALPDADHLGHDAGDFRRGVELPLALAGLGGEVAHQVFVSVAQKVVALGAVAAGSRAPDCRRCDTRLERRSTISLPLPSLSASLKSATSITPLRSLASARLADDLVHLVADLLVALQRHHVGKSAALGHVEQGILLAGVFVGDVFDEQENEDVILVLRGVHAPAQLVAAFPERAVKFGFLDGHSIPAGRAIGLLLM